MNYEAALRRMVETGGECRAAVHLHNPKTGAWYEWDYCNQEPGHGGPHSVWSERYSDEWATWTDGGQATSRYVDLLRDEQRLVPSPWFADELAALEQVRGKVRSDG